MSLTARAFLRTVPMFSCLSDEELDEMVACVTVVTMGPEDLLFAEGDEGDGVYVVESGTVEVFTYSMLGEMPVTRIGPREILGELAFLDGDRRSASARAVSLCRLYRVDTRLFAYLRRQLRPSAVKVLRSVARTLCARLRDTNEQIGRVLVGQSLLPAQPTLVTTTRARPSTLPDLRPARVAVERLAVFEYLNEREREVIANVVHLCALRHGDVVFAEGDPATSCLIVVSGKVGVFKRRADGVDEQIARLGPGTLVGHVALIDSAARSATCVVVSERAVFLELRRIDFDRLFNANNPTAFKVFYQVINDLAARLRSATEGLTQAKAAQSLQARQALSAAEADLGYLEPNPSV